MSQGGVKFSCASNTLLATIVHEKQSKRKTDSTSFMSLLVLCLNYKESMMESE
jgi:hypothetical protein